MSLADTLTEAELLELASLNAEPQTSAEFAAHAWKRAIDRGVRSSASAGAVRKMSDTRPISTA